MHTALKAPLFGRNVFLHEFVVHRYFENGVLVPFRGFNLLNDIQHFFRQFHFVHACLHAFGAQQRYVLHGQFHTTAVVAVAALHCVDQQVCPFRSILHHAFRFQYGSFVLVVDVGRVLLVFFPLAQLRTHTGPKTTVGSASGFHEQLFP